MEESSKNSSFVLYDQSSQGSKGVKFLRCMKMIKQIKKQKQRRRAIFYNVGFFILSNFIFITLMPKHQIIGQPAQKNIKNIYVRKIHSLLKMSGDDLHLLPKEKKIKKTESCITEHCGQISRKEKNKESARKARLRKKIYINLLEKTISQMEKWVQNGEKLERQSGEYLGSLQSEAEVIKSLTEYESIDHYFINVQKFSNNEERGMNIFQYGKEIRENFYLEMERTQVNLGEEKLQKQLGQINLQVQDQQQNLASICNEANELLKKTEDNECKLEQEIIHVGLKNSFLRKNSLETNFQIKKNDQDYNIKYAQNLRLKLDDFLSLKIEE